MTNAQFDYDVFISYSRRNQVFVRQLAAALQRADRRIWVDWEGIPAAAQWRPEIMNSIEASNNFVFVISPDSIASQVCGEELAHGLQHRKRLIPIVCQDVDPHTVHPALGELNWIFFREGDDFDCALQLLLTAMDTDLSHTRAHTRLIIRAREWQERQYAASFLLRGIDLVEAEQWLHQATEKQPQPNSLQQDYIAASRRAEVAQHTEELALRRFTPQQYRNRQALISKVRNFWVHNVLETSLHGQAWLELGLQEHPEAIAHPWEMSMIESDCAATLLPAGTQAIAVFDQMGTGRTLLILGEPGSGKTTTLLELARDLLTRAEQDLDAPIPVVFNLSSWQGEKQAIARWLVEELNTKYQVPKNLAEPWVTDQQLLLLLDGLDEVKAEQRNACVTQLNDYSQQTGTEMVVCSRTQDYKALSDRLQVQNALLIQPLSATQIDRYLARSGTSVSALRTLLQEDAALQELAQSPLMLNIMTLAYQGIAPDQIPRSSVEESRRHLLETYVQRMLQHRPHPRFSDTQTHHWLSRLAQQLVQESQTVFLIERMQPTWLRQSLLQWVYTIGLGVLLSVGGALLLQPILAYISSLINIRVPLSYMISAGVLAGVLWGIVMQRWQGTAGRSLSKHHHLPAPARMQMAALGSVLWGLNVVIWGNPVVIALLSALLYGLLVGLLSQFLSPYIQPVETLKWSWENAGRQLLRGMRWSLVFGLLFGWFIGIIETLRHPTMVQMSFSGEFAKLADMAVLSFGEQVLQSWPVIILNMLAYGLLIEILGGLLWGLIGGLSGKEITVRSRPNQGIWQSVINAGIFSVVSAIAFAMMAALIDLPVPQSMLLGVLCGLLSAGVAGLQHGLLRCILWARGNIPWNYAKFLDHATRQVLLQKVGGGYIFIHRLLLEHFANHPS